MNRTVFESLVDEALNALPELFQEKLDNVVVVVEDWPSPHVLSLARASSPGDVLGFYHGVPQTERTLAYNLIPPDKIIIYRRPIEMHCRTAEQARLLIQRVLQHEIAHHFGIDDERLREIGAY
jgi:predicted Zn-dependent protease with MMP-like domain